MDALRSDQINAELCHAAAPYPNCRAGNRPRFSASDRNRLRQNNDPGKDETGNGRR